MNIEAMSHAENSVSWPSTSCSSAAWRAASRACCEPSIPTTMRVKTRRPASRRVACVAVAMANLLVASVLRRGSARGFGDLPHGVRRNYGGSRLSSESGLELDGEVAQRLVLERPRPLGTQAKIVGDLGQGLGLAGQAEMAADDRPLAARQVAHCAANDAHFFAGDELRLGRRSRMGSRQFTELRPIDCRLVERCHNRSCQRLAELGRRQCCRLRQLCHARLAPGCRGQTLACLRDVSAALEDGPGQAKELTVRG